MAHFRGTIQGTQGEASRLGTKKTGLQVRAQTWGYDLVVSVRHIPEGSTERIEGREAPGSDIAVVELVKHDDNQDRQTVAFFDLTMGRRL